MIPLPPFVLTLLAQGLGLIGNAVLAKGKAVIEDKLGINIETATQSPEGLLKLQQLQMEHEEFLVTAAIENRKIDLAEYSIAAADTSNARDMNTRISESSEASWLAKNIVPVLALIVVIGGGLIIAYSTETDVRMAAVGIVTLVLGFYFGTSLNSKQKDNTIAALTGAPK